MMKIIFFLLYIFCFSFYSSQVIAAPDGAALLSACKMALKNNFQGVQGQMCHWYVVPCNCHPGREVSPPAVCLPNDVPVEELAQHVINGLESNPSWQAESAEYIAAKILSGIYTCLPGH